ncbi:hypothetical protein [Microbacterium neimengense]
MLGGCASTDGTSVIVEGSQTQPGTGGGSEWIPTGGTDGGGATPAEPKNPYGLDLLYEHIPQDEPTEEIPAVTVADLVAFTPQRPSFAAEPAGLGVAGLPTNVIAGASEHTVPGTLFNRPVTVRFAPVGFRFDYGDGTIGTSSTGGAAWTTLGQAQFTPTPTSHTYGSPGEYIITVSVDYAAVVDFGITTRVVNGTVTANAAPQTLRVLEARTALVDKTCAQNPRGPGC